MLVVFNIATAIDLLPKMIVEGWYSWHTSTNNCCDDLGVGPQSNAAKDEGDVSSVGKSYTPYNMH